MMKPNNRNRWILIVVLGAVALAVDLPAAILGLGWKFGALSAFVALAVTVVYLALTRDRVIGALLLFGLLVGFGELPADALDVSWSKTLFYPQDEPLLWTSPLYMPFAWAIVMVQMGFIAWWMTNRWGLLIATVVLGVLGASYVPMFELMASHADYWHYDNCYLVLGTTPVYVIVTESAICVSLPLLIGRIHQLRWPGILLVAVIEAIWMFGAEAIATALTV